jgi:mannose-6-phosphate isomerase-like protein (cupin superfamily)
MRIIDDAGRFMSPSAPDPTHYVEHMRSTDLSIGTYSIPAGATDDQTPHTEDEVYVVTAGRATIVAGGEEASVGPGDTIFVPAGEEHRFVDVVEDLALLVFFAPPYESRSRVLP